MGKPFIGWFRPAPVLDDRMSAEQHPEVRVLTVCGSLQRRSANRAVLDAAAAVAMADGARVDDFGRLAEIPPFDPDREDEHLDVVEDWREQSKLLNTYLEPLPGLIGEDGRLHTTFSQTTAATGRLSSIRPNLQNIPIRTPLGREIRGAFVAAPGCSILSAGRPERFSVSRIAAAPRSEADMSLRVPP